MILPAKGVSRFPTLNTRNDITTPGSTVANVRLLTSAVGNKRTKVVFQAESTTGFQMGTDSPTNDTNDFFLFNNATSGFPLLVSAADLVTLGTAGGSSRVSVAATLGVSCVGAGASSERFGASALAAGAGGVAVGNGASAGGANGVAVGMAASASAGNSIGIGRNTVSSAQDSLCIGTSASATAQGAMAFGRNATCATGNRCAIGGSVSTSLISSVVIGNGETNASPQAVVITNTGASGTNVAGASFTIAGGQGTGTGAGGSVLIRTAAAGGSGSSLNALATVATFASDLTTLFAGTVSAPGAGGSSERFGASATAAGASSTAVGNSAVSAGSAATAVGSFSGAASSGAVCLGNQASVNSGSTSGIAIGTQAAVPSGASNSLVIGSGAHPITNAYVGNGVTNAAPAAVAINASGGSGTDIAGANLTIAAGKGTGAGAGGAIVFQSTVAGASAATLRTLQEKARISNVGVLSLSQESSVQTRTVVDLVPSFVVATDASRTGRAVLNVYDTAAREALRVEASGTAPMIGFLGAAGSVRQTGGAATAGVTYTATEQGMLQKAYDCLRTFGLLT